MFAVPVGELLEGAASLEDRCVVAGTRDELQAYGELFVREATRDRDSGKPAKIADGAQGIGKSETFGNIHVQRSCGNRQRSCDEDVEIIEEVGSCFLKNFADAQRGIVISGRNSEIDVATDFAKGVCEFANFP